MTTKFTEELAKRLKAARKATGYKSGKDFAKRYNIPLSTYSQHETGKRSISAELVVNYSENCGIDPAWMLTGKGEPYPNELSGEKKEVLDRENFSISPKINENITPYINHAVDLYHNILLSAQVLFFDEETRLFYGKLLQHCKGIYDSIGTLNASMEEKKKIIDFSLSSFGTQQQK